MKNLSLISACLLLGACGSTPAPLDSGLAAPPQWRYLAAGRSDASDIRQWWKAFGAPELDSLLQRALLNSQDLGAAVARVRQAQASAVIAGAPLLPELNATLGASRQKLLRDSGYSGTDATSDNDAVDSFSAGLSASYEVDFWGGRRAAYRSALESLKSSEYDRATVELTLLSGVANSYLQVLALREQQRIARLNLDNAEHVLRLVETRHAAGSATALEVAQQSSLVASQRKQLPLLEQQAHEALITLATLIGEPVQALQVAERPFDSLRWPETGAGLPSELLSRRPDIANAEAQLAAAQADVQVARAALFPKLTLSASLSSGANRAADTFRNPLLQPGRQPARPDLQPRPPARRARPQPGAPGRTAGNLPQGDPHRLCRHRTLAEQHRRPRPPAALAAAGAGAGAARLRSLRQPLPGRRGNPADGPRNATHAVRGAGCRRATATGPPAGLGRPVQGPRRRLAERPPESRAERLRPALRGPPPSLLALSPFSA